MPDTQTLTPATVDSGHKGLYPGASTYPGANTYPRAATSPRLTTTSVDTQTLAAA